MPLYMIVMAMYTVLTVFILYIVIRNMMQSENIWEQLMALIVIVPFAMRLFFIK